MMEQTMTNKIRVFAIGSLDATTMHGVVNTNAPMSFGQPRAHETNAAPALMTNATFVTNVCADIIVIKP
jgi:hypothetical protein